MILLVRCEGQRPEAISEIASQTERRARNDTAGGHCEERSDEAVPYSHRTREEIASPDKQTRLAMTPSSVIVY